MEHQILDYDLVRQVQEDMNKVKTFRGYSVTGSGEHVLSKQEAPTASEALKCLRADIRYFKWRNGVVGHTSVIWSAGDAENDEFLHELTSASQLLDAIEMPEFELPPSLLYATAAVLEGCSFLGPVSCPGLVDLAEQGVYCLWMDWKSGRLSADEYLRTSGLQIAEQKKSDDFSETKSLGFMGQAHTVVTYTRAAEAVLGVPQMIDAAVWSDFFSRHSWPFEKVKLALTTSDGFFQQLQELDTQAMAAHSSKSGAKGAETSAKKKRVRIRPDEKATEWAIPHDARVICAGLACVDMQLNHATGGDGGEGIETFEGEKSIGGGSVSMACKTLARLCHGAPLDEGYMQISPPVFQSVVPLCKVGNDDTGDKLLSLLEQCGQTCRNVETRYLKVARNRNPGGRTALAVLPIFQDGRRGCFFDAASNTTFSMEEMTELLASLSSGSSGRSLDMSHMSADDIEHYVNDLEQMTPIYGAFLFGYPHLLPHLQGEALAEILLEARKTMIEGGITVVDLNGVPETSFQKEDGLRTAVDLRLDPVLGAALEHVDIIHMNEDELCLLTGCEIRGVANSHHEDDFNIAQAANLFLLCGVGVVVVTRGKNGCYVACNGEERFKRSLALPASWADCTAKVGTTLLPKGTVINSNGAGDAFTSGFLVATMLRHTGMTVPTKEERESASFFNSSMELERPLPPPAPPSTFHKPQKKLTPYALYMQEHYVSLKTQLKGDKKAIFSRCHEMWEEESSEVKSLYERRANEENEEGDEDALSNVVGDMEALDSTPKVDTSRIETIETPRNHYMTNRSLNLESAVQFASLVAAYHIDVSTRDCPHLDVSELIERSIVFPSTLEEI